MKPSLGLAFGKTRRTFSNASSGFFNLAKQLYPAKNLSTEQQKDTFWMHQVEAVRAQYTGEQR